MQRTIRLKLAPTPEQAAALRETLRQHTACFNAVCAHGWREHLTNGVALHHATYYPLRAEHPSLPGQLVCAARVRATEAVKSALIRQRQGRRVSCPQGQSVPTRYDTRTYRMHQDASVVGLASVAGRLKVPYRLTKHAARWLERATGFDSADLLDRGDTLWLHVVVTLPDVPVVATGVVVGVDLGLNRPAVTSTARFLGERRWKAIERRRFNQLRSLQSKGTRSARRRLKRLKGKRARFRRNCDHLLAKRIVQSAPPGAVIAVENLTDIRKRTPQRGRQSRRRMHSWSFAQLRVFLTYKAEERGCRVVGVDPRHTSQRCSRCGHTERANRDGARFHCRACSCQVNADLNGARNIAHRAREGMSLAGGAVVKGPRVWGWQHAVHSAHKLSALADST